MIRFSAVLVVVAVGVLIGGIATSSLTLVYAAIILSAVALILLGIGVTLKRSEIFGDTSQQVGAYSGAAANQSALGAQHLPGNPVAGNAQAGYGTGWTPPRGAGPAGGVAETRTDLAAVRTNPSQSGSRTGGGSPDETRLDLPATPPAPAPRAPRAPAPPTAGTSASAPPPPASPPPDATSVDLPRIEAESLPPLTPKPGPAADAPAETEAPSASARQAAPTAAQPAVGSGQGPGPVAPSPAPVAPTTIQPAIKLDETSLDLMNTGQTAGAAPAAAGDTAGGSGAGAPSGTSGSAGAPGSAGASGSAGVPGSAGASGSAGVPGSQAAKSDRQVSVVPGVPRYHASNCILIRFMDEGDLEKMTAAAADAAGYTPCGACQADTGSFKVAD